MALFIRQLRNGARPRRSAYFNSKLSHLINRRSTRLTGGILFRPNVTLRPDRRVEPKLRQIVDTVAPWNSVNALASIA